jgi:hypothetical protein
MSVAANEGREALFIPALLPFPEFNLTPATWLDDGIDV